MSWGDFLVRLRHVCTGAGAPASRAHLRHAHQRTIFGVSDMPRTTTLPVAGSGRQRAAGGGAQRCGSGPSDRLECVGEVGELGAGCSERAGQDVHELTHAARVKHVGVHIAHDVPKAAEALEFRGQRA